MKVPGVILVWWAVATGVVWAQEKVNQASLVLQDFDQRVAAYVKLHKAVRTRVHGLKTTNSPEEIEKLAHRLAHGIREERRGAVQGNIFTPEITAEFRRLIGGTLQKADSERIQESLRHAEPVQVPQLQVNHSYPDAKALQSTPPTLLLNLPPLPQELDYRVVGRSLILRDVEANLIVDFIANAVP